MEAPMNRAQANERAARRQAMLQTLATILRDDLALKLVPEQLDPDVPLFGVGFGLDSVDAIELAFAVEREFGLELPQDDRFPLITRSLNCIVDYLLSEGATAPGQLEPTAQPCALRSSVVRLDSSHLTVARLASTRGNPEDALDALEQLLRGSLFLYDGQAKPTLLTSEDGTVEADLTVVNVESEYILLIDGLPFEAVAQRLKGDHVMLRDLRADHVTVSLHGPFAWELLGEWLGRRAISLPPLGALTLEQCLVVRGGRTGEFGYEVVLPQSGAAEKLAALNEIGLAYDLATVTLQELDAATIEVGGFSIRSLGGRRLSPSELQLGWRMPKRREAARSNDTPLRRIAHFVAEGDALVEGSLQLEGSVVGEVIACYRRALPTNPIFGVALLESGLAHSGLRLVAANGAVVHTRSAPLVRAASLSIRPQVDRYRTQRSTA